MTAPRIAFFPDSFEEVNGVAHTSRQFVAFAQRRSLPMLCVHAGSGAAMQHGSVRTLPLARSGARLRLEQDLAFDPLFLRHLRRVKRALEAFRPDVIHITGPSELGILGALCAWWLGVPLAASWHTNLHEYAARRVQWTLRRFGRWGELLAHGVERGSLEATTRFYRLAKVLYAPNTVLCELLQTHTGRACRLMQRGVDTVLFSPARRTRVEDGRLLLGYVGRLSVEKNVLHLGRVHRQLRAQGIAAQWLIVGQGEGQAQLRRELGGAATFPGVLRGEALAEAYANMDVFVFPSHTDTFGNVVLEALASGVPAVVTPDGGPAHLVEDGVTGRIVPDEQFAAAIAALASGTSLAALRSAARRAASGRSWEAVFEGVLAGYAELQPASGRAPTRPRTRLPARV